MTLSFFRMDKTIALSSSSAAAVLESADHDQQICRQLNSNYDAAKSPTGDGEAVGIHPIIQN